jgi:hypothetical protein
VPSVSRLSRSHGRIVFTLSAPGSVTLRLQQRVAVPCPKAGSKSRGCTRYSTAATISRRVAKAGRIAIAMPTRIHGHRLPRGRYHATVTPADPAGRTGTSRTLVVVMR